MAKCLLQQLKHCLRNIECGNSEYIHWFASKYQNDIVTSAIAVFEMSISKALNNVEIDEREFQVLQELNLKVIIELANIDRKVE